MRICLVCRFAGLVLLLAFAAASMNAVAAQLTAAELQRLIQSAPRAPVSFQEVRESPWLSTPVMTRGVMRAISGGYEKRVESPSQETWRLLADRLEWVGPDGKETKQILFSQVPALAPLSDLMRHVVAGDIVELQRDFRIQIKGDERAWTALLQPRITQMSRILDHAELQGTQGNLQVIIVAQKNGEVTTTRLAP